MVLVGIVATILASAAGLGIGALLAGRYMNQPQLRDIEAWGPRESLWALAEREAHEVEAAGLAMRSAAEHAARGFEALSQAGQRAPAPAQSDYLALLGQQQAGRLMDYQAMFAQQQAPDALRAQQMLGAQQGPSLSGVRGEIGALLGTLVEHGILPPHR